MKELMEAWLTDGRDRIGWSDATVRTYRSFVGLFLDWLEKRLDARPTAADVTADVIQMYDTARKRAGRRQRSRAAQLCGIQSFAKFLHGRGLLTLDAAAAVERLHVKVNEKPKKVWATPEHVAALFAACNRVNDHHSVLLQYRGRLSAAVLAVMAYCGLRRSEVCGLKVADVHLDETPAKLVVVQGKGDKARDVWLAPEATRYLRAWLSNRPIVSPDLFAVPVHHVGITSAAPMTPARVLGILKELARLSHIPAKIPVACHAFRRFAATQLLKIPGATIAHVQLFLGHSEPGVTLEYIGSNQHELQQLVLQMDVNPLRIVEGATKPAQTPVRRRQNLRRA